uniref:50S ribosomal protein L17 n=1 Tax=Arabidopsis thaliana TaxID=3702 RepID=Q9FXW8_ARATH|nr:50S ribosomal protein L17 [Arabidopsis thaliana]
MTKFRKLGRPAGHRMSMLRFSLQLFFLLRLTFFLDRNRLIFEVLVSLRTMVSQLVKHERIETTVTKAKEVRRLADNMIQLGKEGSLSAARRAAGFVRGDDVLHKIFTELAHRYKDRAGGYTRLLRTRIRVGDAAPMAYIE